MNRPSAVRAAWLAAGIALAGCGDDAATAPDPGLDFMDVRIEELAPTRAVSRFETSRPASCQAEYGLDSDGLDLTATDPNMVEGQVSSHQVPLEDLVPSSVYAWRARATDERGRTYSSEIDIFETPPAMVTDALLNVALATAGTTIAGKSSNFAGGPDDGPFGALNAIDDKMATEWSSDGDGEDAWIELELAEPVDLVAVGFRSRMMTDGTSIATSVELVIDEQIRLGPFATPDHTRLYRFDFARVQPASRARLEIRSSTGGNTGAREVQLLVAPP